LSTASAPPPGRARPQVTRAHVPLGGGPLACPVMATFALIHGGGGSAWDWHLVVPELRKRGHEPVAVELSCEQESAGWWAYAGAVIDAVADRRDVTVVGHSLGDFTAPLVCARIPADLLILLSGMIPFPGELFDAMSSTTTFRRSSRQKRSDENETRIRRRCGSRGLSTHGQRRRRGTSCVATTACSRPHGRGGTLAHALASRLTRWTAATTSPLAVRASWPNASTHTPRASRDRAPLPAAPDGVDHGWWSERAGSVPAGV
jgi:pimeloyl-ACP methyl ester carboxylesterase